MGSSSLDHDFGFIVFFHKGGQKGSSESVSDEFEILAKPETGKKNPLLLV